jgi:aldose 1-epimerase
VASLLPRTFGSVGGRAVELYRLETADAAVELLTYGGIIRSLEVPDRDGRVANVALGVDDLDDYVERTPYFGCITGRYANRIRDGRFALDGRTYELACNDPPNALHGGPHGFHSKVWEATVPAEATLALAYTSADGEEGFPAELAVRVTYTLAGAELRIDYEARNESAALSTIVNLTNHSYWNLAGEGSGSILDHELELAAARYTPTDATLIPTGEVASVEGTPFDFRAPHAVGERIDADHPQLQAGHGYDHNFVLDGDGSLSLAARVRDPKTGRTLEVLTTEPGIQLYTGNHLDGSLTGPSGRPYSRRDAFALETQHFPDSPNQPAFPSTELAPGATFRSTTVFRFGVE